MERDPRRLITGRLRRRRPEGDAQAEETVVEIDPRELSGVFAAPTWLRDLGILSWLLVGVAAALVGAVWLLALTQTIVVPVIVGAIIASVASPVVAWLSRHHVPRAVGAAATLLVIVALGAALVLLVVGGVVSEGENVSAQLDDAASSITSWAEDAGVDPEQAKQAKESASHSISDGFHALLEGVAKGLSALAGLAVFLTFTVLSLFFLLKDGPVMKEFIASHLGVPRAVGQTVISRTTSSLRSYFLGMTIVSAFSATIVGIGSFALDVDLAGTIIAVTFLGGYVPYLGAWLAGAFAVLMALGSQGPETAAALAVIVLLANGALQQIVQPIAYGATLGIHPLVVLIVTIAGGSLFGTIGLILAAPLVSACVKIIGDLESARAAQAPEPEPPTGGTPEAGAEPAPA